MATVGSIIGGAFGLIRERPGAVAVWGVVYIVGTLVSYAIGGLIMGAGMMMPGQPVDPTTMMAPGAGVFLGAFLLYLLQFLLSIVLINAVYRALLRPSESSFAFLRIGSDEFRMVGLAIIFFVGLIIFYLLMMLVMVVLGFLGGAVVGNDGPVAVVLGFLLVLGFMAALTWLFVRLSLVFPMTFHRRRIAIDEGWALGKGRFWTLFGSYLVVWLIILLLVLVFFSSTFLAMAAAMRTGNPAAIEQAGFMAGGSIATMLFTMVGLVVVSLVSFVLGYGVVGSAARELLEEKGDVPEADAYRTAEIFE
jgi:hypothetical protein